MNGNIYIIKYEKCIQGSFNQDGIFINTRFMDDLKTVLETKVDMVN